MRLNRLARRAMILLPQGARMELAIIPGRVPGDANAVWRLGSPDEPNCGGGECSWRQWGGG